MQYCVLTFDPQQSPPSYEHSSLFVSSSQYPLPILYGCSDMQPVNQKNKMQLHNLKLGQNLLHFIVM